MKRKMMVTVTLVLIMLLNLSVGMAYGESSEELVLTRGDFVVLLGWIDYAESDYVNLFNDVSATMGCAKYLDWAVKNKIVTGKSEHNFMPEENITRQEAAVMLTNYIKYKGGDVSNIEGMAIKEFNDYDKIAPWAMNSVRYCLNSGIMKGKTDVSLEPNGIVKESEANLMLQNVQDVLKKSFSELVTVKSFDGYELQGKLNLPKSIIDAEKQQVPKIVIYVNGSGPNTYDNRRSTGAQEFNYFDVFAENFAAQNTAFFSYNTRGVSVGNTPPYYANIDDEAYQTYLPNNSVKDIECIVTELKKDSRLSNAKVYLLGWSEGTMIAPAVVQRNNVKIDGLLLAGYCNEKMETILDWQQNGSSSMMLYSAYFDYNSDGKISEEEFEEDRFQLQSRLGIDFQSGDVNADGVISKADFEIMLAPGKAELFKAIENKDDKWLRENYPVRLTSAWFWAHREFAPNKEVMPKLDLPIHIFQGTLDNNVGIQGAKDIEAKFKELGKQNLTVHIYDGADHDLNYMQYIMYGKLPQGLQDIFRICSEMQ